MTAPRRIGSLAPSRQGIGPVAPTRRWSARSLARGAPRRSLRLWLPVTPIAVILAPFALLAIPILQLALARRGLSPWRTVLGFGALLAALSGTIVEVDSPAAQIRIRIF